MPKFRITNRGAHHRRKVDGKWRKYGFGDEIEVRSDQELAKLSNLRLVPVIGTPTKKPEEQPLQEDTSEETSAPETSSDDDEFSEEKVKEFIERVEESRVDDGSFEKVREELVQLDWFENLPETKKGVLEALNGLLD